MTSRLDRLFILLESGSSAVTRRAAAKQIGDVQKLHPHELHNLLNRLLVYLHSTSWDTRIAASQAVDAILSHVPAWTPKTAEDDVYKSEENSCDEKAAAGVGVSGFVDIRLTFENFDVATVLQRGARLMGSEGSEFDSQDDHEVESKEHLQRQRQLLNEKLGFSNGSTLGININDLVTLDDMRLHPTAADPDSTTYTTAGFSTEIGHNQRLMPVQEILRQSSENRLATDADTEAALSCREMNRAKRKARQFATSTTVTSVAGAATASTTTTTSANTGSNGGLLSAGGSMGHSNLASHQNGGICADGESATKYAKLDVGSEISGTSPPRRGDAVPDGTSSWEYSTEWPLDAFCSRLYLDLFSPRWETRHGAATALRELLRCHSGGGGKVAGMSSDEMQLAHHRWLEDAMLRLLCVLALDRFGDFVSDQVVAPVRETCAQVLGAILKEMPAEKVRSTVHILLSLVHQREWEVRHGGLLGIKYVLVVREDLLPVLLPVTINQILAGLFDAVDDVGAVAASTLVPIAAWLPKLLTASQVSAIVKMLWDLLLDQDELTSACNSFMGLLSAIVSLKDANKWLQMEPMDVLIPRLWPFLSHNTSTVRRSTLQTLKTLTEITTTDFSITTIISDDAIPSSGLESNIPSAELAVKLESIDLDQVLHTAAATVTCSKQLELNFGVKHWPATLLQDALRHIYQRVLVEHIVDIQLLCEAVWTNLVTHAELSGLLHASCPFVASWMCLAMQPARLAFDPTQLIVAKTMSRERRVGRSEADIGGAMMPTSSAILSSNVRVQPKMYLGGIETTTLDVRERNVPRARCKAAKMLGLLSRYLVLSAPGVQYTDAIESPINCYSKILIGYLASRSALQRLIGGMIVAFWAQYDASAVPGPPQLQQRLNDSLLEYFYYDEVAVSLTRLLQEARDLLATMKLNRVTVGEHLMDSAKILTLDQIHSLATTLTENLRVRFALKPKIADMLDERRRALQQSFAQTSAEQSRVNISTQAVLAGATVLMGCLPEKLNPVIKPIMESIKREECEILQQQSAQYLVHLLDQVSTRSPSPNNKILTNLCTLLRSDVDFTPVNKSTEPTTVCSENQPDNPFYGIITLENQQKTKTNAVNGTANSSLRGPGRPPAFAVSLDVPHSSGNIAAASTAASDETAVDQQEEQTKLMANKLNRIQRIGATHALREICAHFGAELKTRVPILWTIIDSITLLVPDDASVLAMRTVDHTVTYDLITALQLYEVMAPHVHQALHTQLLRLLPHLITLLRHPLRTVRHMSSRCLSTLATIDAPRVMHLIVDRGVELLQEIGRVIDRQGASEAIACIVTALQFRIVPYVILLVVPLLGRMSDPDQAVRLMSTHSFATLIQLMPLDGTGGAGSIPPTGGSSNNIGVQSPSALLSVELLQRKAKDKEFLEYLFTPKKIPDFRVPVTINAELRSYQQSGINWLWFLNKYKLHGILCDDMGLGKTLQTICLLAGAQHERSISGQSTLPSLVICPPTLTGHWVYEVSKFLPDGFLCALHYVGQPHDRERHRRQMHTHNLVVASYDIVRKDIEFFASRQWNYVVLDEGHIIKNGKTKSSKAIKQLVANHRLILSGTPIQNNVLELWSLFDFLMPGFLGTEKQFVSRFSRPILASRDPKSSARDQEAGVLAMEALHRQVLPFLLRRVKEDVLTDLPPKITQDLLCELSPLQERLYEDFSRTHMKADIKDCLDSIEQDAVTAATTAGKKTHVFQALRYLQNVCNHPKLVLTAQHPERERIALSLQRGGSSLDDIEHSAKLPALKQLLLDCGIGTGEDVSVNQHRALIFCQLKAMLDIVEHDLLRRHLPAVSYLRLDGSVPPSSRHNIVTKFNSDPSIDVLLLTTQVGGLGLNLTGADTVIFVEHDWNPMKDLQAMDRAHRIGQRKVVNVYRLITRKSLEEKIMGLQKFKIITANTIVSDENAAMETMQTDQLFDLFHLSDDSACHRNNSVGGTTQTIGGDSAAGSTMVTMKQAIETLPELWEDQQYEEEYDMSQFLLNMK